MSKNKHGGELMKKMFWTVAGLFIFSLLCLACPLGYAQEKPVTLNFASFFPPENRVSLLMVQWCQEVEKKTNGRVKVTYFAGGTLVPAAQIYPGVVKGIADIGLSFMGYTWGRFPLSEVIEQPIGYKSGYVGTKLANEFYKKFKPKEFDDAKVLFLHTSPPHLLFAKKPINRLEDLQGLKIRTNSPIAKALGAVQVGMPMSEAYDALSKGVVQGIIGPYEPMKGFRLAEVVNHSIEYGNAFVGGAFVVMNKDKWNAFPADIQKIIEEIDVEYIEKLGRLWDDYDKEAKDYFIEKGGKVIVLPKAESDRWAEKVRPLLDDYVKQTKAKGLPGDEALKFFQDYLKTHQN
jgi:TRAP-type C4-dicarboxylate transport system substrate-binding protein